MAGRGGGPSDCDWVPYLPRNRYYDLPLERWEPRKGANDGKSRESADHEIL
jgi:hypothetical protein